MISGGPSASLAGAMGMHDMVLEEAEWKEQDTQKEGPKELTFSLGRGAHRVSGEE